MKRTIAALLMCVLILALLPLGAAAAGSSGSLTGPGTIRAGDTITLTLSLNGKNILGATGTLNYDKNQLEYVSPKQLIASPWMVEFNGNNFVAYDNNLTNPINSSKNLLSVTFKVKNVAVGTKVTVSYKELTTSDGNADSVIGTVSYTAAVAAPLSTENKLASLTVSNATISPAFSATTTSYTAEVPFEVSKLDVKATAADSKARVSINSPNLTPNGVTNVTITVTAENGSTKTYTIAVRRAQDPNYQASGNNDLSGITVNGFLLSPVFSAGTTEYVVWLPYETERISITGTPADSRANVRTEGGEALIAGQDNAVKVICTAENGTEKVYTVIVKRAAPHGETPTEPTEPPTDPTEPDPTEPAQTDPTEPSQTQPTQPDKEPTPPTTPAPSGGIPWWTLILVAAVCLAIGIALGFSIKKKK